MTEQGTVDVVIRVEDVVKRFGQVEAVRGVTFDVRRGECFGLLGTNGAGKSTTIKMMTTLLPVDAGRIEIAGYSVVTQPALVRRCIGYVPQMLSVDGALTGYENLLIFARLYGSRRSERQRRIEEVLAWMGLVEAADRPVRTYSGGMIRRLEIAQAVLHRPEVLFLDEPTVGLDPVARRGVWEHIEALRRMHGMTVILTTHYMDEAESLCHRIAMMSQGRIAAIGSAEELRAQMGKPDATMDEVFAHFAGPLEPQGGDMRNVARSRRTARRLG